MTDVERRSNHEGTQPRKVKGRDLYRTQVMVDGRRHTFYGKTAAEAAEKRRRRVRELEAGLKPADPRYTVKDWLRDWLALYCGELATRTVQSYTETVNLYLVPAIGHIRLAKLHQDDIARMLDAITGIRKQKNGAPRPLSSTSKRYVHTVLRIALGVAMEQDRILRNPAALVSPPPKRPREVVPLAGDTETALDLALVGHRHRALILTALTAGLREGELLGLTWASIDLEAAMLHVTAQLERGSRLLVPPKRGSRRSVDLPPQTVEALREHRTAQKRDRIGKLDWDPRDFVFTTPTGQAHVHGMPRRVLRSVLRRKNLPLATTHQLRHTYVADLLDEGVPLSTISGLVGHNSLATTMDQYGHLTPAMRREAAEAMGRRLRRKA